MWDSNDYNQERENAVPTFTAMERTIREYDQQLYTNELGKWTSF